MSHRGHERPPPRRARTARDERRRALGQNFISDPRLAAAIVAAAAPRAGELAVDLGAGRGAITRALLDTGARVHAVERDPDWVRALRADLGGSDGRAAAARGRSPHLEVVAGDLLVVPLPAEPFVVVANLPYGVGTAAVRRLLEHGHGLRVAVVVLQLEAARRLAGVPRGGRFSATWAPWYGFELVRTVPASAFRPVPKVDAGVLRIVPRRPALLTPAAFARHERVVDAAFAGRGRTVAERLGRLAGRPRAARDLLRSAGLDGAATPGQLAPEDWAAVTRALDGVRR